MFLPGRIEVREDETLAEALRRFRHAVRHASRRQWSKTRPGCYEMPNIRRRRRESTRRRNAHASHLQSSRHAHFTVYMTLAGLFARSDPFAARRNKKRRQMR